MNTNNAIGYNLFDHDFNPHSQIFSRCDLNSLPRQVRYRGDVSESYFENDIQHTVGMGKKKAQVCENSSKTLIALAKQCENVKCIPKNSPQTTVPDKKIKAKPIHTEQGTDRKVSAFAPKPLKAEPKQKDSHTKSTEDAPHKDIQDYIKKNIKNRSESKKSFSVANHQSAIVLVNPQSNPQSVSYTKPFTIQDPVIEEANATSLSDQIRGLKKHLAIDFYLNLDDSRLKELKYDREEMYRKLIQNCVEGVPKKQSGLAKSILAKHLRLADAGIVSLNEHYFWPIVEMEINSQDPETCLLILKLLSGHFSRPKVAKSGKEVTLAFHFLENSKNHPVELSEPKKAFELLFLKASPAVNFAGLFLSKSHLSEYDMAVPYCLLWVKKVQNYNSRYTETDEDKKCYTHLRNIIPQCSQVNFQLIYDAFNKINLSIISNCNVVLSIQSVFNELLKRSFKILENNFSGQLHELLGFCVNPRIVSNKDLIILKPSINDMLLSVAKGKKNPASVFLNLIYMIVSNYQFADGKKKAGTPSQTKIENTEDPNACLLINLIFENIIKTNPDKLILEEVLEIYAQQKDILGLRVKVDNLIGPTISILGEDVTTYSEKVKKGVLDNLKSVSLDFNHFLQPNIKVPRLFIEHFICLGIDDGSRGGSGKDQKKLFTNLIGMARASLHSNPDSSKNVALLDNLFEVIPYLSEDNSRLVILLKEILMDSKADYSAVPANYFSNLYNIETLLKKEGCYEPSDFEGVPAVKRSAFGILINKLIADNVKEAYALAFKVLEDRHLSEFEGHSIELYNLYKTLFNAAKIEQGKSDPLVSLNLTYDVLSDWIDCQIRKNEIGLTLMASRYNVGTAEEKQAHRDFLFEVVSTYKNLSTRAIKRNPSDKKTYCFNQLTRFQRFYEKGSFDIVTKEDLENFKNVSKVFVDFIIFQNMAGMSRQIIDVFFEKLLEVLSASTYRPNDFKLEIKNILEAWSLIPGMKIPSHAYLI